MARLQDASERRPRQNADERAKPLETLNQLLKLTNKLMAPFSAYLERQYAISLNEFRLLMLIGQHAPVASHELIEMTGVGAMSVSRAVAELKKHGRIEVTTDASNKRRKILSLNEEGRRLYEAMRPSADRVADYLFSDLGADEVEILSHYLGRLVATLEATDEQGNSRFMEHTRPTRIDGAPPLE